MSHRQAAPRADRRTRTRILAVLVLTALVAVLGYRWLAGPSSWAAVPLVAEPSHLPGARHGGLGVADGEVPDEVTVFDGEYPAVARLDPALLGALRQAATDAASDGVELDV